MYRPVVKQAGLADQDARNEVKIGRVPRQNERESDSNSRPSLVAAEPIQCKTREAVNNR